MPSHRFLFYSPSVETGDVSVDLTGDECHHLARVLRLGPGDDAFVTNGRGLLAGCRVETVAADRAVLAVTGVDTQAPGPGVTLALALLKKDRFAQAFEQCVELGITRCVPFVAAGSHLTRYGAGTMERLRRVAVSAMKQSFRAWLPALADPVGFEEMLRGCSGTALIAGEQGGGWLPGAIHGPVTVVVGPEAGLSNAEIEALRRAGASFASVSRHRLRAETAAVALVAAVVQAD